MYTLTEEEIDRYISSGDPMDKAGSYGIQGRFAIHIKGIHGDYNNNGRASGSAPVSGA